MTPRSGPVPRRLSAVSSARLSTCLRFHLPRRWSRLDPTPAPPPSARCYTRRRTYEKLGETERAAQWAARALHGAIATPEDLKTHAAALELLKTLSPDRYQDAIDDGAQRALDDAEVPVPVEQRTDGFRGDPVPATVEGNTSAISRVRKLIE